MGRLEGKVAFITGAARGQGRSHAVRLAEEGADIIGTDLCRRVSAVSYAMATSDDLRRTVAEVEALGRRMVAREVDVRDRPGLQAAHDDGVAALGGVDIVLANAGIAPLSLAPHEEDWQEVLDVNLTGVYNTVQVAVPGMVARARGGAVVLTGSIAGLNGVGGDTPGGLGYTASKHGVVGLMRSYANILGPHRIRVNSVHPAGVDTPMLVNDVMDALLEFAPDRVTPTVNALPVDMVEARDVSNAVAWLVSDEARYVTGVALPVDAGFTNKK